MTMFEPSAERRTDTGVEFEEFLDLPILDPEAVERVQAEPHERKGRDADEDEDEDDA